MPWLIVGLALLVVLAAGSRPPPAPPRRDAPGPGEPPPPTPPPAPPRAHFREIAPVPEQLELEPGTTYLAQANVPFLLGALVGEQQIREKLEGEGFVVMNATTARPENWPSDDVADWYITTTYTGDRRPRQVPDGITRLWQAVAAADAPSS